MPLCVARCIAIMLVTQPNQRRNRWRHNGAYLFMAHPQHNSPEERMRARAQAIALGMPDLRMVVYPQPKLSDVESSAPGSARQVVDLLTVMVGM